MTANISEDIRELLDSEARRINSPAFIAEDPVQFPRLFDDKRDIEIVSLLSATIAWGNRKMICRNIGRMLSLMGHAPYHYVMERGYEDLPDDDNVHRTFFTRHLKHMLTGFNAIYTKYPTLEDLAKDAAIDKSPLPAWSLVERLNHELKEANGGREESRCFPLNLDSTALKRINMALRWLVRKDGIVDIGIWDVIKPSQLYIPLDVHVGNTARELGLLTRKANDKRSTLELTETLRQLKPEDPVWYDYALFGIGVGVKTPDQAL